MPYNSQSRSLPLFLTAVIVAIGLLLFGPTSSAQAADDYPWSNAAAVPGGTYQWGYTSCPDDAVDCMTLKDKGVDGKTYGESDPWGYYFRNCTSWVAWKLSQQGYNAHGLGNAKSWGANAPGGTVNMIPARGAVAWYEANAFGMSSYGHVAWVADISADGKTVTLEEYNNPDDGKWHIRTIDANRVSGYIHFADLGGSSGSGSGISVSPPRIFALKRTTDPNGVCQVYAVTNTAVTEGWWVLGGDGVHVHEIIRIDQHNIVGFDKVNLPGGTQALYTATSTGVWETWWKPDGSTGQGQIISGLSGVKGVAAVNAIEDGQFAHHLYVLAGSGPYEAWWKDGGDGVHLSLLASIPGGTTFTVLAAPDGRMHFYVSAPTWVYDVSWHPGLNDIQTRPIINITQGDIRAINADTFSANGLLLYTMTSTTVWQSYWAQRAGIETHTVMVGQSGTVGVKKTNYGDSHQLYLATSNHVQEYWWKDDGTTGGGELVRIAQNNIGAIDKVNDGASQDLYTGAGNWIYETWWGGGKSPSTSGLFSVAH